MPILKYISSFVNIVCWFLIGLLFVGIFENLILYFSNVVQPQNCFIYPYIGVLYSIGYFAKIAIPLCIFFLIGCVFSDKLSSTFLRIFLSFILFLTCGLIAYYSIAGVPLDRVVFIYSFSEIIEIINSSQKTPLWSYVFIIGIPIMFYIISSKKLVENEKNCIILVFVILGCTAIPQPKPSRFDKIELYYISENKIAYMLKSFLTQKSHGHVELTDGERRESFEILKHAMPEVEFIDDRYPFVHKDMTNDVLSPFFRLQKEKPNIVIIIAEGLGREFSGENSLVPSATPFLDSLSEHSLVWTNCMSTSQRTIGALPSIIGSLPFGKSGFMNYKEGAPNFNSLLTISHNNGYYNSFFYGGWLCFDDMCHFLRLNNLDNYLDVSQYDSTTQKNTWGLYDNFVFQEAIKSINFSENKPRIDIYLTLTTHDPFEYPQEAHYCKRYNDILQKSSSDIEQNLLREYASYLYLDESLQNLISLYKKKDGFENTLFLITGDHDFCTWRSPLVCHNVPLIIWSPMLKRSKKMKPLVSHRDITPSILALLKNNYTFSSPQEVSFLNQGLDTTQNYRSKTFSPLMDVGRNIYAFIHNDRFYYNDKTYKIHEVDSRLSLTQTDDDNNLKELANAYKKLDLYVCENNTLIKMSNQSYDTLIVENLIKQLPPKLNTTEEFPLTVFSYIIQRGDNVLQLNYSCNVYIPQSNENSELYLITEIRRDKEQVYWTSETINNNWYTGYNKWEDFSTTIRLKREYLNLHEGDEVTIYFWNKSELPIGIKDVHQSAVVLH